MADAGANQPCLLINGQLFGGWKEVSIDISLQAAAAGFRFAMTDRYPAHPEEWRIEAGDDCEIWIGNDKVLTGYVDEANYDLDPQQHPIEIIGRSKIGDLVDCSVVHSSGTWLGGTLQSIASEICKKFGVNVIADAAAGKAFTGAQVSGATGGKDKGGGKAAKFGKISLQQAETVFELLDRLARQRGVLLVGNSDGDLEIRQPGQTRGGYSLAEGVNFQRVRFSNSARARFSLYIVKGHTDPGEFLLGTGPSQPKAQATDPGMTRYRPLVIINEDTESGATLPARAQWEASVRAAQARTVTGSVKGWRDPNGALFQLDQVIPVFAPTVGVAEDLLVSGVSFIMDSRGQETRLTLVPKAAFSLVPLPPKGAKTGNGLDPLLAIE